MKVEPAHVDQILRARTGEMVAIDKDVGGVAEDLKRIDPGLKVRFAETGNPPFWAVYHESDDQRTTYLVLTAQAHQTRSGTWSGLDQRIVKRIMEIGHSTYDYAKEVQRQNQEADRARDEKVREGIREKGELLAHAIRKDKGSTARAFIPRDV